MAFTQNPTRSVNRSHNKLQHYAYSCYGFKASTPAMPTLGFNGQTVDPITGNYHLGIGYRAYNCILMRFHSPDSASPFERGGLNAYAYCSGDPVNYQDPSGHGRFFKNLFRSKTLSERRDISLQAIEENPVLDKYKPIADNSLNKHELKLISKAGKGIKAITTAKAENEEFVRSLKPTEQNKYLHPSGEIKHDSIGDQFGINEYHLTLSAYESLIKTLDSILPAYSRNREPTPHSSLSLAEQSKNLRKQ